MSHDRTGGDEEEVDRAAPSDWLSGANCSMGGGGRGEGGLVWEVGCS